MNETRPKQIIAATAIAAVALVICTLIAAGSMIRVRSGHEIIQVTGSAQRPIRSDFIIWKGRITAEAATSGEAYTSLQASVSKANTYLNAQGISAAEITTAAVATKTLYAKTPGDQSGAPDDSGSGVYRKIEGYELSEEIEVRSPSVDLVDSVSRRSTELISRGVPFESEQPEFLYTKLSDLKIAMLAEAAKDARSRASQIATSSGCRLGQIRFARMGVLQIEPLYTVGDASEISDSGSNDTTSLDKKIIAVVTAGYSIK